jgi:hypothetical protein
MGIDNALLGFHNDVANFLKKANQNTTNVKTWGLIFIPNQFFDILFSVK